MAPKTKKAEKPKTALLPKKGGRPSAYREEYVRIVRPMAALGMTEYKIAETLGINATTLWRWKQEYPEFCKAISPSDEEIADAVSKSLVHRALGYTHKAVKIMTVASGGGTSEVVEVPYVEHYPPDTAAAKFLLMNLDKRRAWNEKAEIESHAEHTVRIEGGLPKDEQES